jgi:hypothetical protein
VQTYPAGTRALETWLFRKVRPLVKLMQVSETMGMSMHPARGLRVPVHTVMVSPTSYEVIGAVDTANCVRNVQVQVLRRAQTQQQLKQRRGATWRT